MTNVGNNRFVFERNGAHNVLTLLSNGVAEIGTIETAGSTGNDTEFDFNGGTLRSMATTRSGSFFGNVLGAAYVRDGGAVIDARDHDITIAQPLLNGGVGGLTKIGPQALTLAAAATHTYIGPTVVNNGALLVNGTLGPASAVIVAPGAMLGGTGTVGGAVTVNAVGTISPGGGIGSIGTLTLGNSLTLNSGAVGFFELNRTNGTATNDYLAVSSALNVTGGILTVSNTGPALVLGNRFKLLSQPVSGFTTLNLPALNTGLAWANNLAVDGSIAVVVATPPPAITSVAPSRGRTNGGTLVAISGSNFVSGLTVQFGGISASSVNWSNAILVTALTPASTPGPVNVTVQNPDLQTAVMTNGFAYVLPPPPATISSVVASGTNLALVWLGGTNASCPLLTATDITQAVSVWIPLATNNVLSDGRSTNMVPINAAEPQRFYLLSVPYN